LERRFVTRVFQAAETFGGGSAQAVVFVGEVALVDSPAAFVRDLAIAASAARRIFGVGPDSARRQGLAERRDIAGFR